MRLGGAIAVRVMKVTLVVVFVFLFDYAQMQTLFTGSSGHNYLLSIYFSGSGHFSLAFGSGVTKMVPMGPIDKTLRGLSDKHLKDLISLALKEQRRRAKIACANARWTCGEGLNEVILSSVEMLQKD